MSKHRRPPWIMVFLQYVRSSVMLPVAAGYSAFLIYYSFSERPANVCSGLMVTNSILNGMLLIPVLGITVGSWIAIREFRSGLRTPRRCAAGAGRYDASIELLAAMLLLVLPALIAYLVQLVAISIIGDCDGQVNGFQVLATALGSALSVAVGYWVGYVLPYLMVPPVLIGASYLLVSLISNSYGDWFTLFFPVTGATMSVFYGWTANVFAFQLMLFMGGTLLTFFARALASGRSSTATIGTLIALVLVTLGGVTLGPLHGRWEDTEHVVAYEPYCVSSAPEVCVHPAFRRAAPLVGQAFSPFMNRVIGTSLFAKTLEQRPRSSHGAATIVDAQPFHLDTGDNRAALGSVLEYVEDSLDSDSCYATDPEGQPRIVAAQPFQAVVLGWLLKELENGTVNTVVDGKAAAWFSGLTESGRRIWFQKHAAEFLGCTLSGQAFR